MKSINAVQLGLGLSLVTMLVTSGPVLAEDDLTPLSEPGKAAPSWKITRHADRGVVELMTGNEGGTLSTLCTDDACGVFVEPSAGCVPGANYPVLINSSKRVGVVPTRCAMIKDEAAESGVRYVAMFREQNAMLQAMLEEMDLSIAFPTQAGDMNVIDVAMSGVRDMLASVLPRLPEIAANAGIAAEEPSPLEQLQWQDPADGQLDGRQSARAFSISWQQ